MANPTYVAVVTGANRGIGLGICKALVAGHAGPLILYATSRSGAIPELQVDTKSTVQVIPVSLTITDKVSVESLAARIKAEQQGCDVLINNAGVYFYREDISPTERRESFDVNYHGTLRVCRTFLPLLRGGRRIVNVSSQSGSLHYFAPHLRERFSQPELTSDQLDTLVAEYKNSASKGKATQQGWPSMTYFTTKAALNAGTRILARENHNLLINCCCPGWVNTSLGSQAGTPPKTIEEGTRIPLRLAFGDINGISGRYWANDSVADTGFGKVQPF